MSADETLSRVWLTNIFSKSENKLKENVKYFDLWAKTYDSFVFHWFMLKAQQKTVDEITKKNFSALDASCGSGEGLIMLAKKTANSILGIDISEEMLKKAKEKTKSLKNVRLKRANVDKIPFKNKYFDVVMSTEAFHHYVYPEKAIREFKRVLKRNGELIITDVDFFLRLFNWLMCLLEPGCVHVYNKKEMNRLFMNSGFKNIQQKRVALFFVVTKSFKQ